MKEQVLFDPSAFYMSLWTDKELFSGLTSTLPRTREQVVLPPESFAAVARHLDDQFVALARRLLPHLKKEPRWGLPTAKVVGAALPPRLLKSPELASTVDLEAAEHSEVAKVVEQQFLYSVKEWVPPDAHWHEDLETGAVLFDQLMECLEEEQHSPRERRYSATGWLCDRCWQEVSKR
jgi:hypothetical protein